MIQQVKLLFPKEPYRDPAIGHLQDAGRNLRVESGTRELAKLKAEGLGPGDYMIFSQTTSNKTILTLDGSSEPKPQ